MINDIRDNNDFYFKTIHKIEDEYETTIEDIFKKIEEASNEKKFLIQYKVTKENSKHLRKFLEYKNFSVIECKILLEDCLEINWEKTR